MMNSRDRLAELFRPELDTNHSHGSLRVVLSEIYKILDPEIIPVTNELVGPMDIGEFQTSMARVRMSRHYEDESSKELLQNAVSLYSNTFLYGLTLK